MKIAGDVLRCGSADSRIRLSTRDIQLLDGEFFFPRSENYRACLGLNFAKGLAAPPEDQVLLTHKRAVLHEVLKGLLRALEDQRDLISHSYEYHFSGRAEADGGGGQSGFRVRGLFGLIAVDPGYCTLRLSDLAPTGRGRLVEIIDMRVRKSVETDDWGTLTVSSRKASVGWFEQLPPVISWLAEQASPEVEVLHG